MIEMLQVIGVALGIWCVIAVLGVIAYAAWRHMGGGMQ